MTLFVNGIPAASTAQVNEICDTAAMDLAFGGEVAQDESFCGQLDLVQLSTSVKVENYFQPSQELTVVADTALALTFDNAAGRVVPDISNNERDAKLSGAASLQEGSI